MIPVIIEALGIILESFRKYLSSIRRNHEIKALKIPTLLGTAHILWKVLMQKYRMFNTWNNFTRSINCK